MINRFSKYLSGHGQHSEENKSNYPSGVSERHGNIPDFLLCRIMDDFMVDPVIIQSGFTYERKAILKHF